MKNIITVISACLYLVDFQTDSGLKTKTYRIVEYLSLNYSGTEPKILEYLSPDYSSTTAGLLQY